MRLLSSGSLTSDQSSFGGFWLLLDVEEEDLELDFDEEDLLSRCLSDLRSDMAGLVLGGDREEGRSSGGLMTILGGPLACAGSDDGVVLA